MSLRATHIPGSANSGEGRHGLQGHAGVQATVPGPGCREADWGSIRLSVSGSVCIERERAVCAVLLPVKRGRAPGHICLFYRT